MKLWKLSLCLLLCAVLTACGAAQKTPEAPAPAEPAPVSEPEPAPAPLPPNAVIYTGPPAETEPAPEKTLPSAEPEPAAETVYAGPPEPEPAEAAKPSVREIKGNEYSAKVSELKTDCGTYSLSCRTYEISDGARVEMFRAQGVTERVDFLTAKLPAAGSIHYYNVSTGEWEHPALAAGSYGTQVIYVETEGGRNYFIYTPSAYDLLENHVIDHRTAEDGAVTIEPDGDGWRMTVSGSVKEREGVCDCLILSADFSLTDWNCDNCGMAWQRYMTNHQGRWCYDGFYYTAPDSYIPTGPDCYYRCAACYIIKVSLGRVGFCPCAPALVLSLLDTVTQVQNGYGYWETGAISQWLQGDYGIGAGFYDTRFNTDLMEIFYLTNVQLGGGLFRESLSTYLDFYLRMAEECRYEKNGGWLIPDYWWPGEFVKPHTALNHQAAECLQLYHLSDLLGREDTRALADKLLLGMTETAEGYVMPDHNLHYCVRPDFTYGLEDYPELTYNDLLALDRYLIETRGAGEPKLEMLMAEKKIWMDANGVTTYNS